FRIVAESESKAHALPIEEVHFHEVGAVDSIVDIVSIAVCMDDLGIDSLIVPYLCEGQGTVRCAHGILPIPVPAVQNITQVHAIPLRRIDVKGEFVTPTGAAAVAAFRSEEALPSTYIVRRTGIGAGKRQYERASMVRLMEIETTDETSDFVWRLETDIDDSSAERLGYLMNSLFIAGAREVHYAPIYMKKNRPGVELVVLCDDATRESIENRIFEETTTIGIRRVRMGRTVLARSFEEFQTEFGTLAAKRVRLPDGRSRIYPEYEEVVSLAERSGKSFFEAWSFVEKLIQEGK
ncbi:MAG: LarC family nickel insertion protein, partial [Lachnospiraceae bacterium]|nr:LarC family nickel insertion protein [Lachnospiraceae bacterium]